jgi:uncharacterized protein (TIGR03083 family)
MTINESHHTSSEEISDQDTWNWGGPARYSDWVAVEGERFARAAGGGRLDVPIAACPGWDMRELVRHLGEIHLWAAANVAFPRPRWLRVARLADLEPFWPDLAVPVGDDDLVSWYQATHTNLLRVLRTAPSDVEAFTFVPAPTPLTMWSRRQASEIAVHRFDAELARGMETHFDADFASDMLDELVAGLALRSRADTGDAPRVLHLAAVDAREDWWVAISPAGITTSRSGGDADLTMVGTAADLYLTMWNRTPASGLELIGDPQVIDLWRRSCRIRWSG